MSPYYGIERPARVGTPRIYVASSWRNPHQPAVVKALREANLDVYDFKAPEQGANFQHWPGREPGADLSGLTPTEARALLHHPDSERAFLTDWAALTRCDGLVAVAPFGASAGMELGWAVGKGKPTWLLLTGGAPELMGKMAGCICASLEELVANVRGHGWPR